MGVSFLLLPKSTPLLLLITPPTTVHEGPNPTSGKALWISQDPGAVPGLRDIPELQGTPGPRGNTGEQGYPDHAGGWGRVFLREGSPRVCAPKPTKAWHPRTAPMCSLLPRGHRVSEGVL